MRIVDNPQPQGGDHKSKEYQNLNLNFDFDNNSEESGKKELLLKTY